jgi:hypothetical protein
MASFTIETSEDETYRLCYGSPDAEEWDEAGEVVDYGERAMLPIDAGIWFAFVDTDGTFDGFAYRVGGSSEPCAIEEDCDFDDEDEDEDTVIDAEFVDENEPD